MPLRDVSQVLVAFCLHQSARLDVCIQSPSSCLCHVAVRDWFAGPSSSVLYWSLGRSEVRHPKT